MAISSRTCYVVHTRKNNFSHLKMLSGSVTLIVLNDLRIDSQQFGDCCRVQELPGCLYSTLDEQFGDCC